MKYKHTKEQIQEAVNNSLSMRQLLTILGIANKGGSYKIMYKRLAAYEIDISHFTGQAHNKGKKLPLKRPIEDYLSNSQPIESFRLKKRLIREGILLYKCSCCNLTEWLGAPIPIELDHINGNSDDNSLENLRLLCPNCHALTETYRGKNKKTAKQKMVPSVGLEPTRSHQ